MKFSEDVKLTQCGDTILRNVVSRVKADTSKGDKI